MYKTTAQLTEGDTVLFTEWYDYREDDGTLTFTDNTFLATVTGPPHHGPTQGRDLLVPIDMGPGTWQDRDTRHLVATPGLNDLTWAELALIAQQDGRDYNHAEQAVINHAIAILTEG